MAYVISNWAGASRRKVWTCHTPAVCCKCRCDVSGQTRANTLHRVLVECSPCTHVFVWVWHHRWPPGSLGPVFCYCMLVKESCSRHNIKRLAASSQWKTWNFNAVLMINKPSVILCNSVVWWLPMLKLWHSPYPSSTCKRHSPCLTGLPSQCAGKGHEPMWASGAGGLTILEHELFHFHADSFFDSGYSGWCLVLE